MHCISWPFRSISTYLGGDSFVLVAGDWHHIGPISRSHDDPGDLGAGDVEGGGAFVVRALDAGAAVLIGILVMAEHTRLQWEHSNWLVTQFGDNDFISFVFLTFTFVDTQKVALVTVSVELIPKERPRKILHISDIYMYWLLMVTIHIRIMGNLEKRCLEAGWYSDLKARTTFLSQKHLLFEFS